MALAISGSTSPRCDMASTISVGVLAVKLPRSWGKGRSDRKGKPLDGGAVAPLIDQPRHVEAQLGARQLSRGHAGGGVPRCEQGAAIRVGLDRDLVGAQALGL